MSALARDSANWGPELAGLLALETQVVSEHGTDNSLCAVRGSASERAVLTAHTPPAR